LNFWTKLNSEFTTKNIRKQHRTRRRKKNIFKKERYSIMAFIFQLVHLLYTCVHTTAMTSMSRCGRCTPHTYTHSRLSNTYFDYYFMKYIYTALQVLYIHKLHTHGFATVWFIWSLWTWSLMDSPVSSNWISGKDR